MARLDARAAVAFFSVIGLVLFFVAYSIYRDVSETGMPTTTLLPFVLLGVAEETRGRIDIALHDLAGKPLLHAHPMRPNIS